MRPDSELRASGFVVLRLPQLPIEDFLEWSRDLATPGVSDENPGLAAALQQDRQRLRERLVPIVRSPVIREALFLASPDLFARLSVYESHPESDEGRRLELSVAKYFTRMCCRATPFGLCGGITIGKIGDTSVLTLPAEATWRRYVQLDSECVFALAEALSANPQLREQLHYRANDSLVRVGAQLRYVKHESLADNHRAYRLVAVENGAPSSAVLEAAAQPVSFADLVHALEVIGVPVPDATSFVHRAIDAQLLRPLIEPPVTGPDPLEHLLETLRDKAHCAEVVAALQDVQGSLTTLRAMPLGCPIDAYNQIENRLRTLPQQPGRRVFHVDMYRDNTGVTVGPAVLAEIKRGVALLYRLRRPAVLEKAGEPAEELAHFRREFQERFGDGEVDLLTALDDEAGVKWRLELHGSDRGEELPPGHYSFSERDAVLMSTLLEMRANELTELTLSEIDVQRLSASSADSAPRSCVAAVQIEAASAAALASGDVRVYVKQVTAPSGAGWLGRFCGGDPALKDLVRAHIVHEDAHYPDAILAEVVHLPFGRAGNFLLRPVLRSFEIPFLAESGIDPAHQIPVSDLGVSVRGDRILLRSRSLGREVIPRITNAHNPMLKSHLTVYKFLCLLQHQDEQATNWSWGVLAFLPYLPRVCCGRIVLALARWRLSLDEVKAIDLRDEADRMIALRSLRRTRRIPRFVFLVVEGDNELLLDLDNPICVDILVGELRSMHGGVLIECFPNPPHLGVQAGSRRFVHELLVPLHRPPPAAVATRVVARPAAAVSYPPGSEWTYLKLYTGQATSDRLLTTVLYDAITEVEQAGLIDRWFFIRYVDPLYHLRLRLHGDRAVLQREVVPRVLRDIGAHVRNGTVARVQFDTYQPEVTRYGGSTGVLVAEQIFHADSRAALTLLRALHGESNQGRIHTCLLSIDLLLECLGFGHVERLALMEDMRKRFAVVGVPTNEARELRERVGASFRQERAAIEALLSGRWSPSPRIQSAIACLLQRSSALVPSVERLSTLVRSGEITERIEELAISYVHLLVNRLFRSASGYVEFAIYDTLARHYRSAVAKARAPELTS